MEERLIPCFDCELVQCSNRVSVPIPYGNLENMVRSLLANNPETIFQVRGIVMIKI